MPLRLLMGRTGPALVREKNTFRPEHLPHDRPQRPQNNSRLPTLAPRAGQDRAQRRTGLPKTVHIGPKSSPIPPPEGPRATQDLPQEPQGPRQPKRSTQTSKIGLGEAEEALKKKLQRGSKESHEDPESLRKHLESEKSRKKTTEEA